MSIEMAKQYVYKNLKNGKYISINTSDSIFANIEEVYNIKYALKINEFTIFYGINNRPLPAYIKRVPYDIELRNQKLKELKRGWLKKYLMKLKYKHEYKR